MSAWGCCFRSIESCMGLLLPSTEFLRTITSKYGPLMEYRIHLRFFYLLLLGKVLSFYSENHPACFATSHSHRMFRCPHSAVLLAIIVEKSKKCLDFSLTLFLIHLGICTAYAGMPRTWDWWIANILGTIIMVLLGEYICSYWESMEIPLLQI
jgi:Integral membrane protein S linking to the trans Golgi network